MKNCITKYSTNRVLSLSQICKDLDILGTYVLAEWKDTSENWYLDQPVHLRSRILSEFQNSYQILINRWDETEALWACNSWCIFLRYALESLLICKGDLVISIKDLIMPHERNVTPIEVIKSLKNACLRPMSRLCKTGVIPDALFRGKLKRIVWNWISTRYSRKKRLYCNTMLQLKRVCPKVPESFLSTSLQKHRELVSCTEGRQSDDFIRRVVAASKTFVKGFTWKYDHLEIPNDFTLHSCSESAIKSGGVYGYWLDSNHNPRPLSTKIGELRDNTAVSTVYRWPFFHDLEENLREIVESDLGCRAVTVALAEPLKVRVITKNPAACSALWAPFQKKLQKHLTKFPEILTGKIVTGEHFEPFFSFVKKRKDWVIISDDASNATDNIRPDFTLEISKDLVPDRLLDIWTSSLWSSVEYPGDLTRKEKCLFRLDYNGYLDFLVYKKEQKILKKDNLDFRFEGKTQEEKIDFLICTSLVTDDVTIECGIVPHMSYQEFKSEGLKFISDKVCKQSNGQMMGDRRSFPLLCLIHLSVKKLFLKEVLYEYTDEVHWRDVPVAVNGDDGLICLPKALIGTYFRFVSELWDLNPLKSYIHRDMLSFNSTFWQRTNKGIAKQLPLIRWNLICNNRGDGSRGKDPSVWNEVLSSLQGINLPDLELRLFREFQSKWVDILHDLSRKGGNYFLPREASGLGLIKPKGVDLITTPIQRGNVTYLIKDIYSNLPKGPRRATKIEAIKLPTMTHVKTVFQHGYAGKAWIDSQLKERIGSHGPMSMKEITEDTKMSTRKPLRVFSGKRGFKFSLQEFCKWKYRITSLRKMGPSLHGVAPYLF